MSFFLFDSYIFCDGKLNEIQFNKVTSGTVKKKENFRASNRYDKKKDKIIKKHNRKIISRRPRSNQIYSLTSDHVGEFLSSFLEVKIRQSDV